MVRLVTRMEIADNLFTVRANVRERLRYLTEEELYKEERRFHQIADITWTMQRGMKYALS